MAREILACSAAGSVPLEFRRELCLLCWSRNVIRVIRLQLRWHIARRGNTQTKIAPLNRCLLDRRTRNITWVPDSNRRGRRTSIARWRTRLTNITHRLAAACRSRLICEMDRDLHVIGRRQVQTHHTVLRRQTLVRANLNG